VNARLNSLQPRTLQLVKPATPVAMGVLEALMLVMLVLPVQNMLM
jgi:hypothetical protein